MTKKSVIRSKNKQASSHEDDPENVVIRQEDIKDKQLDSRVVTAAGFAAAGGSGGGRLAPRAIKPHGDRDLWPASCS